MPRSLGQILIGGMGAMPPRRGSTPPPRPNLIGDSYITQSDPQKTMRGSLRTTPQTP